MKKFRSITMIAALCLGVAAGLPGRAVGADAEFDPDAVLRAMENSRRAVAERMEQATVFVLAETSDGYSTGTGFFVAPGYIVTNHHVAVAGVVGDVYVFNKFMEPTEAKVIGHLEPDDDFNNDLALLKVDDEMFADWPYLTFAETVRQTDRVSAWGYPSLVLRHDQRFRELSPSAAPPIVYSEGSVSALVANPHPQVMHTAIISGGNSGGPLVNLRGEVVGINTYITSTANAAVTMGGALGIQPILNFLYASDVETVTTGEIIPPDVKKALDVVNRQTKAETLDLDNPDHALAVVTVSAWMTPNAEAFTLLAGAYLGEDEIEPDLHLARHYLAKAAELGNADAVEALTTFDEEYGDLGEEEEEEAEAEEKEPGEDLLPSVEAWCWYYGIGRDIDYNEALRLARIAAKDDDSLGKAVLAILYYDGYVVKEDLPRALKLAQEAADGDEPMGMGLLSLMYYFGVGVDKDAETALKWAMPAAAKDDPLAQYALGHIFYEGDGVERDLLAAWALFTRARETANFDLETLIPRLESEMTPRQLRQAGARLEEFIEKWDWTTVD